LLDARVDEATLNDAPLWLRQLLAIWHCEQARIVTFNYDTLLERALNGTRQAISAGPVVQLKLRSDLVVYPAPPATQALDYEDMESPTAQSMQILKLHGSLDWYWASGDANGSTLIRVRQTRAFGGLKSPKSDLDFSGVRSLDRYLIPPVTKKDGYYGSYLANTLWRTARQLIEQTQSVTFLGYSLPAEDRVSSELIGETQQGAHVEVVDRDPDGILGRPSSLGIDAEAAASGDDSIQEYVASRMADAISSFQDCPVFDTLESTTCDIVFAIAPPFPSNNQAELYLPVWNEADQAFDAHQVEQSFYSGQSMPYRDSILNSMPRGYRQSADFVTAARLREMTADGVPFVVRFPNDADKKLVAIGAKHIKIERWELLQVYWAPIAD
jgi:hypothetical protein